MSAPSEKALAARQTLDHETMWRYLRRLLDRVFGVLESDAVMDDCLDILVDVLGPDRGLILLTHADGGTSVVNARGQGKLLSLVEREEMSKTVIRQALDTGECVTWDPLQSASSSASVT